MAKKTKVKSQVRGFLEADPEIMKLVNNIVKTKAKNKKAFVTALLVTGLHEGKHLVPVDMVAKCREQLN